MCGIDHDQVNPSLNQGSNPFFGPLAHAHCGTDPGPLNRCENCGGPVPVWSGMLKPSFTDLLVTKQGTRVPYAQAPGGGRSVKR